MTKPTLLIDFDGVVHAYTSGWKGESVIPDPPVPGAMQWLLKAAEHFRLVIYTRPMSKAKSGGRTNLSHSPSLMAEMVAVAVANRRAW